MPYSGEASAEQPARSRDSVPQAVPTSGARLSYNPTSARDPGGCAQQQQRRGKRVLGARTSATNVRGMSRPKQTRLVRDT